MFAPTVTGHPAFSDNEWLRYTLTSSRNINGRATHLQRNSSGRGKKLMCINSTLGSSCLEQERTHVHIWMVLYTHCPVRQCPPPTGAGCKGQEQQDQHQCKLELEEETTYLQLHPPLTSWSRPAQHNASINARAVGKLCPRTQVALIAAACCAAWSWFVCNSSHIYIPQQR